MATRTYYPSSTEEKLIWFSLVWTYAFFAIGATYVVGCVVGWLVIMVAALRLYVDTSSQPKLSSVPVTLWVWIVAMLVMLIALWVAHDLQDLGMAKTIKSSIGWAKGWALLALFLAIGALCDINPRMIIRACCKVSLYSLIFFFIGYLFSFSGMVGDLFVSPLKAIGGPGADFFKVSFYSINPETHAPRWRFFGPWAPSAGLLSCVYLVLCSQEQDRTWRRLGIAGAVVMCLACQSRAGMVIFVALIPMLVLDRHLANPKLWLLGTLTIVAVLLLGQPIIEGILHSYEEIKQSRPKSTQVRAALEAIALERWQSEAPIWGHGIVENGPKMVEFMPIGSHHSWYGLLFVKGIVGFIALLIPMVMTAFNLLTQIHNSRIARIALMLLIILTCYSFTENLEILTYLFWPALIIIGMALNPLKRKLLESNAPVRPKRANHVSRTEYVKV